MKTNDIMTPQEALKAILNKNIQVLGNHTEVSAFCEGMNFARSMLGKQIPKKVKNIGRSFTTYACPVCENKIVSKIGEHWHAGKPQHFCDKCGQALDWSDT